MGSETIVPHQDDKWDAAVASMPAMHCGRLDMNTYDAATGEPQRFVYVEGVEDRTLVQGPYCDEIAYAAQSYARLLAEVARLREALEQIATCVTSPAHRDYLSPDAAKELARAALAPTKEVTDGTH